MHRRVLGVGAKLDPQAGRRPARRLGREIGERLGRLVAGGLERVGAEIERRAGRQRRALLGALVAEHAGEIRIEPFGIIAEHVRRRAREIGGGEPAALGVGQRRRRITAAVGEPRHGVDIEAALANQHAEQRRARRVFAHEIGRRGAAAQRVIDKAGDAGAIAGAGEAVREAPVLQRVGRGPSPRADIGEHFDRGGEPRAGGHYGNPSMILTMKISHMIISTNAPMPNSEPRARRLLLVQ